MTPFPPQAYPLGPHLVEVRDQLDELREISAFLLKAYENLCAEPNEITDSIRSGAALVARDVHRRIDRIDDALTRIPIRMRQNDQ